MTRLLLRMAVLVAMCAVAVLYANHVPSVVPDTAPATEFSAARAMRHVRAIAERPHPIGTEDHRRVATYILGELTSLGVQPAVQEATGIGTRYPAAGRVRNIVARIPGRTPGGPAVLLMAHYDGVPAAPGAGDDASGSAVLLETVRALRAGPALARDVIVLIDDGEEAGLLGAAAFVREHAWARDVEFTLNFEARGTTGPSLMFETGEGNLDAARLLRGAGGARATSLSTFVYRQLPNDTDISETARLRKPAMNFAFIGGVNRYHTAQDDTVHLDPRSVQHHGDQALALTRAIASGDLPRPTTGDAVFFNMPLLGLVVYPETWSPVFAAVLLVPLVFVLVAVRRGEPRWVRGVLLGVVGAVLSITLSAVAGVLAANGLRALHVALGRGQPAQSGVYVAMVAALAFAISCGLYVLFRRWSPARPLQAGGLTLLSIVAVFLAMSASGVSFMVLWPALVMAIAMGVALAKPSAAQPALWAGTIVAAFVLVPIVYLMGAVALGLDQTGGAVVAVYTALIAWLVAHVMEAEGWPAFMTPATGLAAAALLLLFGIATVRTSVDQPVGSSFGYGVDADANVAYYGVSAQSPGAVRTLRALLPPDPDVAAPAWFTRHFTVARPAPPSGAGTPRAQVHVISDSATADGRKVALRITAAPGARAIGMRVDSSTIREVTLDGRLVDTTGYRYPPRGRWTMEFYAPPPEGFELTLTMATRAPFVLQLASQIPGLPRIPGLAYPARPAGIIPIQRGDFTLVHQGVRVGGPN